MLKRFSSKQAFCIALLALNSSANWVFYLFQPVH